MALFLIGDRGGSANLHVSDAVQDRIEALLCEQL
jgi:hypothetical protein